MLVNYIKTITYIYINYKHYKIKSFISSFSFFFKFFFKLFYKIGLLYFFKYFNFKKLFELKFFYNNNKVLLYNFLIISKVNKYVYIEYKYLKYLLIKYSNFVFFSTSKFIGLLNIFKYINYNYNGFLINIFLN